MSSFRELYDSSPPDLRKIIFDQWKAKQNKDWHPEGNTLKHIIVVTNRAFAKFPSNKNVQLAAYFHDLGKLATYALHPQTGRPTAYGHEFESSKLVKKHETFIKQQGADPQVVDFIVTNHMRAKSSTWDKMRQTKKDVLIKHPKYQDLLDFTTIDKGGLT